MLKQFTGPAESKSQELSDRDKNPSQIVAEAVARLIKDKPDACLALPTGRTPLACYKILSEASTAGELDWSRVGCFGLDEYVDAEERHSFRHFLQDNLYCNTNVDPDNLFNPLFYENYDEIILSRGGLDLCILGIGRNGHIAFNEPGTPLSSWTHSVWLSESTRKANAEFFPGGPVPTRAVTMGISTILRSREIILMVIGAEKREILSRALRGRISSELPASFLQLHPDVTVLADFDY